MEEVLNVDSEKKQIRTVLYPRVSTSEQHKEGTSFEAQIDKFKRISASIDRQIIKLYKGEGDVKQDRSARIKDDSINVYIKDDSLHCIFDLKKRPNFKQMLIDAKKNMFDEIMFYKWDRFSRNYAFQALVLLYLDRSNVKCYPTDDTKDPFGRDIMSIMNEMESKKTGERIKNTLEKKFLDGKMISTKMPMGYKFNKDKKTGEVIPKQAEKVKLIFQDTALGKSYKEVCDKFNLSPSTFYSMIRNKVYIGLVEYNGKTEKGIHDAIISEELFEKANKQLSQ